MTTYVTLDSKVSVESQLGLGLGLRIRVKD
jgi:hypothetical protein